jgi:hypothetical protein
VRRGSGTAAAPNTTGSVRPHYRMRMSLIGRRSCPEHCRTRSHCPEHCRPREVEEEELQEEEASPSPTRWWRSHCRMPGQEEHKAGAVSGR